MILGISDGASTAEVKRAYRAQMRRYHPDYNPDPGAPTLVLEITEAHRVLSHQELRAQYDRQRNTAKKVHLVSASGMEIGLGALLGRGGRSRVYRVADRPRVLVKIFEGGATQAERNNLTELLAVDPKRTVRLRESGETVPTLAWPEELVFDGDRVVGYLMAEHPAGGVPLNVLTRLTGVPAWVDQLDLFVRLHVGMNLALLVEQVHAGNLVVGNLNPNAVYVAPSLVVTLIGCDSFVVAGHPRLRQTYMEGYVAPEVARGGAFSLESDRFVLAVLLHELLPGRHPYRAGNAPRDLSDAALTPLRSAFDRALRSSVYSPEVRLTPREWIRVLQKCAKSLRPQAPLANRGGARGNA
nr:DnaJ domain-containing protein [Ornithinimicrobium cryptoxanthini]